MRSLGSWLVLVSTCGCAALLACSATSSRPDAGSPRDDGGRPEPDAGKKDPPSPVPTIVSLENTGSEPFVVGNQCGGSFLTLSHDGEQLAVDRSCACSCDMKDACGCPPVCLNTQQLVVPGESASFEWDGLYARFDEPGCYEIAGLATGDVVNAEACWNETEEGEVFSCASADFTYGTEREVTIAAEHHSAARTPQAIVLDNLTGGPIEIVTDDCGVQTWFALALPETERASLSAFCPCACDADFEMEPGSCPVCGGCAEPVTETIEPGSSRRFDWDGMFFYTYESGCANRYPMPAGYGVSAEVCFERAGASVRECLPVRFVLGETDTVHFEAR